MAKVNSISTLLRSDEGNNLFAYRDTLGYWTIGVGRCVEKHIGTGLRQSEVDLMLKNDIEELETRLPKAFPFYVELSDVRKAVLMSVAFNTGFSGLMGFHHMLDALTEGNWKRAHDELLDSRAAIINKPRYERLALMMLTNEWPA